MEVAGTMKKNFLFRILVLGSCFSVISIPVLAEESDIDKRFIRIGVYADYGTEDDDPNIGLRVNAQFKHWDADVYLDQDADVNGYLTLWVMADRSAKWRGGVFADYESEKDHPDVGLRLNRRFKHWDADVYLNQDKDVRGQVAIWF